MLQSLFQLKLSLLLSVVLCILQGGPTGVEYCGELIDFLDDITLKTKSYRRQSSAPFARLANYSQVILLQGAKELLLQFDPNLRVKARIALEERGVKVITNAKVSRIDGPDKLMVLLENKEEDEALLCGLIVWAAGTAPRPLTEKILSKLDSKWMNISLYENRFSNITSPMQLSKGGRLPVDSWLRVIGAPTGSFLAMGDASLIVDDKDPLPQTAQVAAQQGAYVARLFNRMYDLKSQGSHLAPINPAAANGDLSVWLRLRGAVVASPFSFLNLGQLAFLGGGEALSQLQLGDQPILYEAGSVGFLLWRSVYIVKQVSTRTRLLVLFDWFKSKVFGRYVLVHGDLVVVDNSEYICKRFVLYLLTARDVTRM
jgi:NADH dehydrogenase FAD-containing subunit